MKIKYNGQFYVEARSLAFDKMRVLLTKLGPSLSPKEFKEGDKIRLRWTDGNRILGKITKVEKNSIEVTMPEEEKPFHYDFQKGGFYLDSSNPSDPVLISKRAYVELKTAGELPPLPYDPFDENIFEKLPTRSKTIFRVLHRLLRTEIQKSAGYKGIGLDVLKALLKVLENRKLLRGGKIKGVENDHISKVVIALLNKEKGLPKLLGDKADLPSDVETAIYDYEHTTPAADKPIEFGKGERFIHFGPSLKTLTVAPVHVPWNKNLKFKGFLMSEFPGVQKNAPGIKSKDLPLMDWVKKSKARQSSPPTIIYSRSKKSYKPIPKDSNDPYLGLGRGVHRVLLNKIQRGNAKKLKSFLLKYNIPHEKTFSPSVYEKIIVQYLTGPWKDKKNPTKPFRVTVFLHGVAINDSFFNSQSEAEKSVKSGVTTIVKSLKSKNVDVVEFNYNKQKFTLYPLKVNRILTALSAGKRFRLHRLDGDYLIYRGEEPPRVRNDWDTRQDIQGLNAKKKDLEKQVASQMKKMDKAPVGEKLQYRSLLIKLKKELMNVNTDLEKVQTEAKDVRAPAERIEPAFIKPLKANIRMVSYHA